MKILPHGEIPYNGEEELPLPVHSEAIDLNMLPLKVFRTMDLFQDFLKLCKEKKRQYPMALKEIEMSEVDKSHVLKTEKFGAIKNVTMKRWINNGKDCQFINCYVPTALGRAIIKEIQNVRKGTDSSAPSGDSGSV